MTPTKPARFLIALLHFVDGKQHNEQLGPIFNEHAEDWLRFNPHTWIVWTDKGVQEWYEILRHHMTKDDTLLILRVDPSERTGWATKEVWEWIDRKRT